MAKYIELEISKDWPIGIGGKSPGSRFKVEVDNEGVILEQYWRKRLLDEKKYKTGAVLRIDDAFDLPVKQEPVSGEKAKKEKGSK